jgi:hypothetical protein
MLKNSHKANRRILTTSAIAVKKEPNVRTALRSKSTLQGHKALAVFISKGLPQICLAPLWGLEAFGSQKGNVTGLVPT